MRLGDHGPLRPFHEALAPPGLRGGQVLSSRLRSVGSTVNAVGVATEDVSWARPGARHTTHPLTIEGWLRWASHCHIPAFVKLARTVRKHQIRILAAVELNLSNSKIRLINPRGDGHHSAAAVVAMIDLCCGGSLSNYQRQVSPDQ